MLDDPRPDEPLLPQPGTPEPSDLPAPAGEWLVEAAPPQPAEAPTAWDADSPAIGVLEPPEASEAGGRSCLRNCLFTFVTLVVVLSLLGTSIFALIVIRRDALLQQAQRQIAALAAPPTPFLDLELQAQATPTAAPSPVPGGDVVEPTPEPQPVAIPTEAEQGSASPLNRIALVNEDGQIETIAADGTGRRVLTRPSDGSRFQFPAWSPDGSQLAVVGNDEQGGGIYVLPSSGSAPARLERQQVYYSQTQLPFYLYWSPDSQQISFLANHSRDAFGLSIVPGDGTSESQLLTTGSPIYWEWAADSGEMLVHSGESGRQASITWLGVDGSEENPNVGEPGYFQTPGISASGRYLAVAEQDGRGSVLVLIDNSNDARRRLETSGSMAFTWSPTTDALAYTSGQPDAHPFWGPLRVLDATTGAVRELTGETVLAFFWSPDGRQLAYLTLNERRPLDEFQAGRDKDRRLVKLSQPVQQRPAGFLRLSVVDVETGVGLRLLDFQPTAVFASQYLPFFAQYALSHRLWSPDSSSLVLPLMDGFEQFIVVVPTDGGSPYTVAEGEIAFWSQR